MKLLRRLVGIGVVGAVALWMAACTFLYVQQDSLIFRPPPQSRHAEISAKAKELGVVELDLVAEDGTKLYGWHATGRTRNAVLFFHGNAGNVSGSTKLIEMLRKRTNSAWHVVVVEYRGYPGSEGSPTEEGLAMDARAAWTYVTKTLGIPRTQVVVHGRSLGTAVATRLAEEVDPGLLVLEAPFTSMVDMGRRDYPIFPIETLLAHPMDTMGRAKKIDCFTLIAHGEADRTVPVEMGRELSTAFRDAKMVAVEKRGHGAHLFVDVSRTRNAYLEALNNVFGR